MRDRRYRPVYVFLITGLILMVVMMNYSFNIVYYLESRLYANAVNMLFPAYASSTNVSSEEDIYTGSVWADSEYVFGTLSGENEEDEKLPATEYDSGVVEASALPVSNSSSVTASGTVYALSDLSDYNFLMKFYTVTSITALTQDILHPSEFLEKDLSIAKDSSSPQILIFHTHSQEGFTDTVEGDTSTTIVGVGDYLAQLLAEEYGYNVYHDTTVYDYVDGKLDRSKAYTYAEENVAKILEENPSIEVVIDLHRDGVDDSTRLVTEVNGVSMAKVMLFNGVSYTNANGDIGYLYNPYRDDNLATSLQMYLMGEKYYPNYFRKIYVNAYRYCLHLRKRSMLVEAGAQTNTSTEVKNAMVPLADIIDRVLRGEKAYSL